MLAFFPGAPLSLQERRNLVGHGFEHGHVRDGKRVRRRRKHGQNADDAILFANGGNYHGPNVEGANGRGIHTRIRFTIVTAKFLTALDAQSRERAFHTQGGADIRSAVSAARAADDLVSIAFAQGDGHSGSVGESLSALGNDRQLVRGRAPASPTGGVVSGIWNLGCHFTPSLSNSI